MDRLRLDMEVKFASDKSGVFTGYGAVTGNKDAGGDVIEIVFVDLAEQRMGLEAGDALGEIVGEKGWPEGGIVGEGGGDGGQVWVEPAPCPARDFGHGGFGATAHEEDVEHLGEKRDAGEEGNVGGVFL